MTRSCSRRSASSPRHKGLGPFTNDLEGEATAEPMIAKSEDGKHTLTLEYELG